MNFPEKHHAMNVSFLFYWTLKVQIKNIFLKPRGMRIRIRIQLWIVFEPIVIPSVQLSDFFSLYGEWNRICIQEIWEHYFANETTMPLQDMYGALSATRQTCLLPTYFKNTPFHTTWTVKKVKQCNICFGRKCRLFCSTLIKKLS